MARPTKAKRVTSLSNTQIRDLITEIVAARDRGADSVIVRFVGGKKLQTIPISEGRKQVIEPEN